MTDIRALSASHSPAPIPPDPRVVAAPEAQAAHGHAATAADARVLPAWIAHELDAPPRPPAPAPTREKQRARRGIRIVLAVYVVALAVIGFWPEHVDRGARGLLRAITRAVPWLTYDVIEFSANVLLFVPLGVLLALLLPLRRGLVVPLALAVTLVIETGQAVLLVDRTPALSDIVANVLGATLGLALVVVVERVRRPR